ncbi:MAG: hypothetical protein NVS9B15_17260 [Acidobacteriaceae bacterium]
MEQGDVACCCQFTQAGRGSWLMLRSLIGHNHFISRISLLQHAFQSL